ncbi:MAG: Fic family protein [Gammaproteobacteria bacterium]|nr:Fic family protein [Gammaproteobacteria bacterium]
MEVVQTLSYEEVLGIHDLLVEDFARSKDPIDPPGIREGGALLESAVSRQHTGYGNELKYPDQLANAASLCYGVCCNHAFHNGNKRTALVVLLCHLDKNNWTFGSNIRQGDLYTLMLKIASHKFAPKRTSSDTSDLEIDEIAKWLRGKARRMKKGEKVVTFRELRKILRNHDIHLENPKNNYIDVVKYIWERKRIFGSKERVSRRVARIPYPREGMEVGKKVLRGVREACGLTEKDGYDTEMFYGGETDVSKFIAKYKKTLKRLARV